MLEGITLGISDYILKPFAPNDLLNRIRRVLVNRERELALSGQEQDGEGAGE